MISVAILSVIASVAWALPQPDMVCGPTSNCETIARRNGQIVYRHKRGMEPGTDDFVRRFGNSSEEFPYGIGKRASNVKTMVTLGSTTLDWGCKQSPNVLLDSLHGMCKDSGACDEGSPFSTSVDWVKTTEKPGQTGIVIGGGDIKQRTLKITADGKYESWAKWNYINAIKAAADPKAVKIVDFVSVIGRQTFPCKMAKFTNYISVQWFQDGNLKGWMDATAELEEVDDSKLLPRPLPSWTRFPISFVFNILICSSIADHNVLQQKLAL